MSQIYPKAKDASLKGNLDLDTAVLKVALVDTASYAYSAAHEFLSDLTGSVVATSAALADVTVSNGKVSAAAAQFSAVTGDPAAALVLFEDTGSTATSRLLVYIDAGVGLPFLPNGSDVQIVWDAEAEGIFSL